MRHDAASRQELPLIWLSAMLVLALATATAAAEFVKPPAAIPNDKGSVVVTENDGKPRWTADWTMEPWKINGSPAVRFTETGRGRYSPFPKEVNWQLEAVWKAGDRFTPLHFERKFMDSAGNVIATEKKDFDESGRVHLEHRSGTGKTESRSLVAPPDTVTVEGIAGILRYLPFETGRPFATHLLSNEPKLYDITIEPRGREMVHTAAGDFDCYKVELVPHIGVLNVFKVFFAKTYFWFTVAPPHFWVRYEGFENGVGTPQIVMELKQRPK